jgi:aconitate hydratase
MAAPHSPGNIVTVRSAEGRKVNQVLIGSCTNSSYRDLKTVALLLKGRHVHPDVWKSASLRARARWCRCSRARGSLPILVSAGLPHPRERLRLLHRQQRLAAERGVSLRTSNRNFEGRSGTKPRRSTS